MTPRYFLKCVGSAAVCHSPSAASHAQSRKPPSEKEPPSPSPRVSQRPFHGTQGPASSFPTLLPFALPTGLPSVPHTHQTGWDPPWYLNAPMSQLLEALCKWHLNFLHLHRPTLTLYKTEYCSLVTLTLESKPHPHYPASSLFMLYL